MKLSSSSSPSSSSPTACCSTLASCFGCGGFRFDAVNNHCYNNLRTIIFFLYTTLWIVFIIVLQASITSTFDYLLSDGTKVAVQWLTLLIVTTVAVFFTYVYTNMDTPEENGKHPVQAIMEHHIKSATGVGTASNSSSKTRKARSTKVKPDQAFPVRPGSLLTTW
jgi:hypothetical protein